MNETVSGLHTEFLDALLHEHEWTLLRVTYE